jgi:hypothetical protein
MHIILIGVGVTVDARQGCGAGLCVCYECWLSVVHGCVCLGRVKGGLAHSSGGVECVLQVNGCREK